MTIIFTELVDARFVFRNARLPIQHFTSYKCSPFHCFNPPSSSSPTPSTLGGSSATDSGNEHDSGAGGMDEDDDNATAAGLAGLIALRGDSQHGEYYEVFWSIME